MGALASLEQREEVRRSLKALTSAGRLVFGDPEHVDLVDASAGTRRVRLAAARPLRRRRIVPSRTRSRRSARCRPCWSTPTRRTSSNWPRAAGAAWSDRSSPATRTSRATSSSARRHGTAGCSCWTRRPERSRPGTARRCRCSSTAARDAPGGGEELGGIRGVLHHMQRTAVQGSPRMLSAVTGRWVAGRARAEGEHPFRKSLATLRIGDTVVAGPRTVTHRGHRALRRVHRRHVLCPHGRGGGRGESVLRRPGRARLSAAVVRGGTVRRSGPGSGPRQLRHRQPAVPDAGVSRATS